MLHVVNDNKLGSHIIYEPKTKPPFNLSFPAHKVKVFKIKVPEVPDFSNEPICYNPGEKPKPSNEYSNNWLNTNYKVQTQLSAINDPFRL